MSIRCPILSIGSVLRKLHRYYNPLTPLYKPRNFSKYKYLKTTVDYTYSGICEVNLNAPPKNVLNLDMLRELSNVIKEMEATSHCRGFILGSHIPRQFSKGYNVSFFYQPNTHELKELYQAMQQLWLDLYGTRLATVAAIKGFAIGYGCLLALCCDYRVAASEDQLYKIGLNEAELGITPPPWYYDTTISVIGSRQAESALSLGRLYDVMEASHLGFVDQVVPAEDVRTAARQELEQMLQVQDYARQEAKKQSRQQALHRLLQNRDVDLANFMKMVTRRQTQISLKKFLASVWQHKVAKRNRREQQARLF